MCNRQLAAEYLRKAYHELGFPVDEDGMRETPERVVKALCEMTGGTELDARAILSKRFTVEYEPGIVIVRDISFTSLCEHHLLPFVGKAHVAYLPRHREVVGVSKIARLVDCYARRLQLQERMGQQVVEALMHCLNPLGAAVLMDAQHACMQCRGVAKQDASMRTCDLRGLFMSDSDARAEVLRLLMG